MLIFQYASRANSSIINFSVVQGEIKSHIASASAFLSGLYRPLYEIKLLLRINASLWVIKMRKKRKGVVSSDNIFHLYLEKVQENILYVRVASFVCLYDGLDIIGFIAEWILPRRKIVFRRTGCANFPTYVESAAWFHANWLLTAASEMNSARMTLNDVCKYVVRHLRFFSALSRNGCHGDWKGG